MKNKPYIETEWPKYKVKYCIGNGHALEFYVKGQTEREAKTVAMVEINKIPRANFISIKRSWYSGN